MSSSSRTWITNCGILTGPFDPVLLRALVRAGSFRADACFASDSQGPWQPLAALSLQPGPAGIPSAPPSAASTWNVRRIVVAVASFIVAGTFITFGLGIDSRGAALNPNHDKRTSRKTSPPTSYSPPPPIPDKPSPSFYPPPDTEIFRDADGRSYRVPTHEYTRLHIMRDTITEANLRLIKEKITLDAYQNETARLGATINIERRTFDKINATSASTLDDRVDEYSRRLSTQETMVVAYSRRVDATNRLVDSFNAELLRVGTPISR